MTEATTSNSNWWLLAGLCVVVTSTIRWYVASLGCTSAMFLGILRAQRFKHTTSHEASPFRLGFLCHLSAPMHDSSEMCIICRRIAVFAG